MIQGRRTGFTLVELVVVVTIVAILAVTIVPDFLGSREEARLRSCASRLVMLMHLATSQAVTTGKTYRVRLRPQEGNFWLERRLDTDGGGFAPVRDLPQPAGKLAKQLTLEVQSGEASHPQRRKQEAFSRLHEVAEAIHFYADGTADGKRIRLRDRGGFGLELTVDPTTARVSVTELARHAAKENSRSMEK